MYQARIIYDAKTKPNFIWQRLLQSHGYIATYPSDNYGSKIIHVQNEQKHYKWYGAHQLLRYYTVTIIIGAVL